MLGLEIADGHVGREAVLGGDRLDQAVVPAGDGAGAGPGLDGALSEGEVLVGNDEIGVEVHLDAEAGAGGAGAVRAVEAEVAGGELADADAAEDAGEVLRVEALLLAFDGDEDDAGAEAERGLDGLGETGAAVRRGIAVAAGTVTACAFGRTVAAWCGLGFGDEAVDDELDGVAAVLVEVDVLAEVAHLGVDADADEAGASGVLEDLEVLALTVADERGEDHDALAFGQGEDGVDDLLDGLALDGAAAVGAVGQAGAGVKEAEVVVDLGLGADGGARVAAGATLVDGDGGGEALDVVDVGLLHLAEELAGVGGEGLDVAALAFGVDGVEGEGGFAGAGEAGDDDELVAGDVDVDVLEVMLAGAANDDGVEGHGCLSFRREIVSGRTFSLAFWEGVEQRT